RSVPRAWLEVHRLKWDAFPPAPSVRPPPLTGIDTFLAMEYGRTSPTRFVGNQSRRSDMRLGRISIPANDPSRPPAAARSPKDWVASDGAPPPTTSSGTGSAVWALRRQDVE